MNILLEENVQILKIYTTENQYHFLKTISCSERFLPSGSYNYFSDVCKDWFVHEVQCRKQNK